MVLIAEWGHTNFTHAFTRLLHSTVRNNFHFENEKCSFWLRILCHCRKITVDILRDIKFAMNWQISLDPLNLKGYCCYKLSRKIMNHSILSSWAKLLNYWALLQLLSFPILFSPCEMFNDSSSSCNYKKHNKNAMRTLDSTSDLIRV